MTGPSNSSRPPDGAATSVPVDASRARSPSGDVNAGMEGIELTEIQTQEDDWAARSSASLSSGETYRFTTLTRSRTSQRTASTMEAKGIWGSVRRFWNGHVVLTVPEKHNRDHFALERTFLAYIRTSIALAILGVLVAQLFRLQRIPAKDRRSILGFHAVGVPLSATCHGVAIVIALLGAYRFWRQQNAVSQEKVYSGGWELNVIGLTVFLVNLSIFILSVAITAELEN